MPSEMIAFGDGLGGKMDGLVIPMLESLMRMEGDWNQWLLGYGRLDKDWLAAQSRLADRVHDRRANMVFCDGHVEALTLQTLFYATNDAALSRWNKDHQPHR